LGGVGRFRVVACVQEVAVTPGELLADADLIHYTVGASEKDEEEAIREAVDFFTTVRRHAVDRSGLPCERAFGIGNRDPPRHTTCWGRPIWENPTYSAFWSILGATCLRS
jgi:hypothetical protein